MGASLVTIITPSLNQAPYIRATIESVLAQDYPNLEYIVMDGGSTDGTADVVRDYASRLTWISEPDRGQSDAINKGFRMARGQIVSWLNSDDVILPGAVSKAVRSLEKDPDLAAVYGRGYQMDSEGCFKCEFPWTEGYNLWKLTHVLDYILQQTVYFRKSVLTELGYLDENLNWTMDWDILVRIGKRYPIGYIPELMGAIREYDTAKSFSGGRRRLNEIARVVRGHTGQRYPPAYVFYALSTYERIWREKIKALTPGPLQGLSLRLQNLVSHLFAQGILKVYRESQGWYEDGWAGRTVHYLVPRQAGAKIIISGNLPDLGRTLSKQTLRLFAGESEIGKFTFGPGEFCFSADMPEGCRKEAVRLRLEADHYFIPQHSGCNADRRKLCYLLKSIDLQPAHVTSSQTLPQYQAAGQ